MIRLPHTIDFDESQHPELTSIFRGIDAAIAAVIASDPAFRPRPASKRRRPARTVGAGSKTRPRRTQRAAA
jgi:hypothetical protein